MQLQDPIATTENCRYCLMCRHVAPVGNLMADEAVTPHGIALTVASQRRGLIDWTDDTVAIVYADPDGGNSRAHCVTNQPLPEAIAAVRAELTAQNLAPAVVYEVHEQLQNAHSPYGDNAPEPNSEQAGDALFVGDEAHYLRPDVVEAAKALLNAVGVQPVLVGRGRSNGYLASSLGFPDTAKAQAQALLDEVKATGASRLFVLSAGDLFTFRQLYDERLGIDWPEELELVDLASFLAERVESGDLALTSADGDQRYAYVDPSHGVRAPDRFDAVRSLAAAVMPGDGVELFWRRERAHPVGSTALQFTRPNIAEALTRARLDDARQTGATVLLCEDPATLHHLSRHPGAAGFDIQSLYGALAERLAS